MVTSTLKIVSTPASWADVVRALTAQVYAARVQPGCRRCDLYQDVENRHVLVMIEEWESAGDLRLRLASDEYRVLLELMERSQEYPEIHFDTVTNRTGLETVEAARQAPSLDTAPWRLEA